MKIKRTPFRFECLYDIYTKESDDYECFHFSFLANTTNKVLDDIAHLQTYGFVPKNRRLTIAQYSRVAKAPFDIYSIRNIIAC